MSRILIVEDDRLLSSILADTFRQNSYEVETAYDGDAAVTRAIELHFDAILLDILLPQKDGFEVLATLKAMDATKAIPVIVISNLSDEKTIQRMKNAGAVSYLVKEHVMPDTVLEAVKNARAQQ